MTTSDEELALSNCESEPVHIPGRLQNFSAILGFDLQTDRVTHMSENFASLSAVPAASILGSDAETVVGDRDVMHAIRGTLGLPTISQQRELVDQFELGTDRTHCDVAVHVSGATCVLELEPVDSSTSRPSEGVQQIRGMLTNLMAEQSVEGLTKSGVTTIRQVTGFDRVMVYQFLPTFEGEVVAEALCPGMTPYLGLRYPASDIPAQVRELMLRVPYRMIADVHDPHTPLISTDPSPLDLTLCHSRGVSPIHLEYLKNMGVSASVNFPIIVRGELWGMFALHHERPRKISPDQRTICELFSQLFSIQLQQELEKEILAHRKRAESTRKAVLKSELPIDDAIEQLWPDLIETVEADGIAIVRGEAVHCYGDTPESSVVRQLTELSDDDILAIDSFASMPDEMAGSLGKSAGMLLLNAGASKSSSGGMQLLFFRNEVIHQIRWGGEPEKKIEFGPNGPRLHPRASFAEYAQTVQGKCPRWRKANLSAAMELRVVIQEVILRDTDAVHVTREKQSKHQDLLIAELNHRVKNVLALVRSISRQTKDSSDSLENYTESFEKRILALSTAHDLIGGSGMQWARLEELIRTEVQPFLNSRQSISIAGPDIGLRADIAPVMALVLHELTTNSAKHGALKQSDGILNITWKHEAGGVAIRWRESNSPTVDPGTRRGFGMTLVERAIPYECNGESQVTFHSDGIEVTFWLPTEATLKLESPPGSAPTAEPSREPAAQSLLSRVLLVEDNMMLALELERLLGLMGCQDLTSVPNQLRGEQALEESTFSLAILDIHLGTGTSFELAINLLDRGVPLILASGYDSSFQLPPELKNVPRLTKPVGQDRLLEAIRLLEIQ